jgi:hypothetical protein
VRTKEIYADEDEILAEVGNEDMMENILDSRKWSGKVSSSQFPPHRHPNASNYVDLILIFYL